MRGEAGDENGNIPGRSVSRHQPVFLGPAQPLDGQFPLQGPGLGRLGLGIGQLHGEPAVRLLRSLGGSVGLQPLEEIVRDARVERAVAAAEEVDEPTRVRGAAWASSGTWTLSFQDGEQLPNVCDHVCVQALQLIPDTCREAIEVWSRLWIPRHWLPQANSVGNRVANLGSTRVFRGNP